MAWGGPEQLWDSRGVITSLVLAVLAQLRGQELVLLLSDHSQLLPGLTKLLFFTQHFLLSCNDLGSNADSQW